eukprot:scaffold3335_cov113-Isochrysis_galbana.AAC.1
MVLSQLELEEDEMEAHENSTPGKSCRSRASHQPSTAQVRLTSALVGPMQHEDDSDDLDVLLNEAEALVPLPPPPVVLPPAPEAAAAQRPPPGGPPPAKPAGENAPRAAGAASVSRPAAPIAAGAGKRAAACSADQTDNPAFADAPAARPCRAPSPAGTSGA